ncbi:MAG: exonuclease domain-containing protein, partial [Oscillospiraceae bacterium]
WEKKWEALSVGSTVIVRGNTYFDKYDSDYVIDPRDILVVGHAKRQDKAEGEKRVELHLHTKLSTMDGLTDVADAVYTAHRWGHRAIAITDHGVAQAFPIAMAAADDIHKTDPDFKLIYGVEAYFVNDMVPCVYGTLEGSVDCEYVVFDIETTGLSPKTEKITEIGAVILKNGEIIKEFSTFVDPEKHIPERITEITGINDAMVNGAPSQTQAIKEFLAFVENRPLVAHNAHGFDIKFISIAAKNAEISFENTYLDTLPMCQSIFVGLKNYKLDTIVKHLEMQDFNHHRALDDAKALAGIMEKIVEELHLKVIKNIEDINSQIGLGSPKSKKSFHMIILVQNQVGLKNLYKLISKA